MASCSIVGPTSEQLELDELRARILRNIDPVLHAAGVDAHEVTCDVRGGVGRLEVVLRGPAAARAVQQTMGVRVVDAVRGGGRTFGPVTIDYRFGSG
jgi:hypothetical protein